MFDINEYLNDLESLVNIDSNSNDPHGLSAVVDKAETIASNMGFYVKRHTINEKTGDVLEISNVKNADHYDVMIMGHLDTVLPPDFSKECPFRCDGEFLYGPGTFDMKAGALCGLYAVKLLDGNTKNKLSIAVILNCDEEISSIYSEPLIRKLARKTDYAFVMESTGCRGTYTTKRKGLATYKIKFHGVPGHSGYIFDVYTANAVVEMARWATELHKMNDRQSLLSVNVAIAEGGKVTNVVPDYAELYINIRVVNSAQTELFESKMQELLETPMINGVTAEIEVLSKKTPMLPATGMDSYLERAKKAVESIGQKFEIYPLRGGCSDGNVIADEGTICIDSLGPLGADDHTPYEKVWLDDVEPSVMRVKALIEEISSHKK